VGDRVRIGHVVGVHGLDGGLRMVPESDHWREWPTNLRRVQVDQLGPDAVRVRTVTPLNNQVVVAVEGVTTREAAERLRGAVVYRPLEDLPPLAPDRYYWYELTGRPVLGPDGRRFGVVAAVEPGRAHDWLVVGAGHRAVRIPFVKAWVDLARDDAIRLRQDPEVR